MNHAHLVNENNEFVRWTVPSDYPAVMSNPNYRNPHTLPQYDGYVPEAKTAAYWAKLAEQVSAVTNKLHLVDYAPNRSPAYQVFEAPVVGDEVSYGFNGDIRPDGTIVKISESMRVITTSSGRKYYRVKETARWLYARTWSLANGHHDERNPHF